VYYGPFAVAWDTRFAYTREYPIPTSQSTATNGPRQMESNLKNQTGISVKKSREKIVTHYTTA